MTTHSRYKISDSAPATGGPEYPTKDRMVNGEHIVE